MSKPDENHPAVQLIGWTIIVILAAVVVIGGVKLLDWLWHL